MANSIDDEIAAEEARLLDKEILEEEARLAAKEQNVYVMPKSTAEAPENVLRATGKVLDYPAGFVRAGILTAFKGDKELDELVKKTPLSKRLEAVKKSNAYIARALRGEAPSFSEPLKETGMKYAGPTGFALDVLTDPTPLLLGKLMGKGARAFSNWELGPRKKVAQEIMSNAAKGIPSNISQEATNAFSPRGGSRRMLRRMGDSAYKLANFLESPQGHSPLIPQRPVSKYLSSRLGPEVYKHAYAPFDATVQTKTGPLVSDIMYERLTPFNEPWTTKGSARSVEKTLVEELVTAGGSGASKDVGTGIIDLAALSKTTFDPARAVARARKQAIKKYSAPGGEVRPEILNSIEPIYASIELRAKEAHNKVPIEQIQLYREMLKTKAAQAYKENAPELAKVYRDLNRELSGESKFAISKSLGKPMAERYGVANTYLGSVIPSEPEIAAIKKIPAWYIPSNESLKLSALGGLLGAGSSAAQGQSPKNTLRRALLGASLGLGYRGGKAILLSPGVTTRTGRGLIWAGKNMPLDEIGNRALINYLRPEEGN